MKAKRSFLVLLGIVLCASVLQAEPLSSFYDDEALSSRVIALAGEDGSYTADQDLSINFLRMLFGSVSSLNGYNMIIGKVFELFNYGLLGIVSFIVGYTILTSVIGTAQDGGGAFSTRVSPWTIARTTTGVTLMVPMGSGYSIVQTMVMKIILFGVAFANTGWNAALSHLEERGNSFIVAPVANDTRELQTQNSKKAFQFLTQAFFPLFSARHQCIVDQKCKAGDLITSVEWTGGEYKVTFPGSTSKYALVDVGQKLYSIENSPDFKRLMDGALRQALNSLLVLSDIHKSGQSEVQDIRLTKAGEQEFGQIYYCPAMQLGTEFTNDEECTKQQGEAYQKIARKRDEVSRKVASQAKYLAGFAANIVDAKPPAASRESWYSSARRTGWLSSGIYYGQIMNFESGDAPSGPSTLVLNGEAGPFSAYSAPEVTIKPSDWVQSTAKSQESVAASVDTSRPITMVIKQLEKLEEYMSYTSTVKSLIPNLAGRVGSGWMYGVDPTKPIQNLAIMIANITQKLVGINLYDGKAVRPSCTSSQVLAIENMKQNNAQKPMAELLESAFGISSEQFAKACVIRGSILHTMLFPGEVVNPLIMIRDLGRTMIQQSVSYYSNTIRDLFSETKKLADGHFTVSSITSGIAAGTESATAGGPAAPAGAAVGAAAEITISGLKMAFNGTKIAMEMFVPVGTAAAGVFFSLGVLLAVYIPMLPFVLFLFGVVAWLMSVTEAMVAAPLVALGMTHPEGHDLLGKSEQALILLLGVFVRPITMLFGILMAIIASQILIKLFHLSFGGVAYGMLVESAPGSGEPMTGMAVVAAGVLLVYVYILMSVIEQSFSLIYVIPERILRWIGGPQDQTGIGQLAEKAKGETQQAAGQAQAANVSGPQASAVDGRVSSGPESQAEKDDDESSEVSGKDK